MALLATLEIDMIPDNAGSRVLFGSVRVHMRGGDIFVLLFALSFCFHCHGWSSY
jgi:hypothetical protein